MDPDVYPAWQHVLSDRKAFVCFRPALALVSCPCVCFSRCVQCPCLKSWTFPHAPPVHEHMGEPEGGEYPADVWCVQKNKKKSKKQSKCGILSERGRWPSSSSSSSLSAVFRYNNRFLTTIIFQWRKAFTNFVLFLFVIYSFVFFPLICVSSSVICWWNVSELWLSKDVNPTQKHWSFIDVSLEQKFRVSLHSVDHQIVMMKNWSTCFGWIAIKFGSLFDDEWIVIMLIH